MLTTTNTGSWAIKDTLKDLRSGEHPCMLVLWGLILVQWTQSQLWCQGGNRMFCTSKCQLFRKNSRVKVWGSRIWSFLISIPCQRMLLWPDTTPGLYTKASPPWPSERLYTWVFDWRGPILQVWSVEISLLVQYIPVKVWGNCHQQADKSPLAMALVLIRSSLWIS